MPCYHPIPGWVGKERNWETGKRPVVFRLSDGFADRPLSVPCGRCLGCRLERARQWALRCVHEASLHQHNSFLTLTYDDSHLEPGWSLRPQDMVLFLKRLRKALGVHKIRYFQAGEYGETTGRPHHHALIFGLDFDDRVRLRDTSSGSVLYRSPFLEKLWPFGHSSIGECNFQSAGYIARYTTKQVDTPPPCGTLGPRFKPYLSMSRRPGLGAGWLDKFGGEVYLADSVIINGKECKPPRYYDDRYAVQDPIGMEEVKIVRAGRAADNPESSGRRLIAREAVKTAATSNLKRELK